MWVAFTKLYQSDNQNKKLVLRENLRNNKMTKTSNVTSYLTKNSQLHDELGVIGEKVEEAKLVRTALNGFSKPW